MKVLIFLSIRANKNDHNFLKIVSDHENVVLVLKYIWRYKRKIETSETFLLQR